MTSWKAPLIATLALLAFGAGGACSSPSSEGGSETNWAKSCHADADCDAGQCVCGKCATTCDPALRCAAGTNPCGVGSGSDAGDGASVTSQAYTSSDYFVDLLTSNVGIGAVFGGCLPRQLSREANGRLPCVIMQIVPSDGSLCDSAHGYTAPFTTSSIPVLKALLREQGRCDTTGMPACDALRYCGLQELGNDCKTSLTLSGDPAGFCYIDPALGDDGALVEKCPAEDRRILRLVVPHVDANYLILCQTTDHGVAPVDRATPGPVGSPCVPDEERRVDFGGFSSVDVAIEEGASACETGICLVDHFQGRTACPYGQDNDQSGPTPLVDRCRTPSPDSAVVTVPVPAQKLIRPPSSAVYCSCRCDGPDKTQTYCTCPQGFECTPLFPDVGLGGLAVGSYCVKSATRPPTDLPTAPECLRPAAPPPVGCGL